MFKFIKSLFSSDKEIYNIPNESIFTKLHKNSTVEDVINEFDNLYFGKHKDLCIHIILTHLVYEVNRLKHGKR